MEANQKMQHRGYEYQIASSRKGDGMFQGLILLTGHAGIPYPETIKILTPSSFKVEHLAIIEATTIACQLIKTGAVINHVPTDENPSSSPENSETPLF